MPAIHYRGPAAPSDSHEEQLLDDAIDDSFPASDPVSHGQPGSILNARYAAERRARAWTSGAGWLVLGSAVGLALVIAASRRRVREPRD